MSKQITALGALLVLLLLVACAMPTPTIAPTLVPTPTALPLLSADQLWQRAQSCKCLTVYPVPETSSGILTKAIESATKSVRLKMYLFTLDDVRDALVVAAKRGVDVRVLLELNPSGGSSMNVDFYNAIKGTPIRFRWTSYDFRFTHEKSLVIDDQIGMIMTYNFTASGVRTNRGYGVLDSRPDDVAEMIKVYEADWEKIVPDLNNARLVWSPVNARQKWLELIDSAQTTLEMEQEEWLAPEIVSHVADAAKRGVRVRVIIPPTENQGPYNQQPYYDQVRAVGGQIKFMDDPHMVGKVTVVDGKRALVGSENVSDNSLNNNRELGILFDQSDAVAVLKQSFEKDWSVSTDEPFPVSGVPIPPNGIVNWKDAAKFYNRDVTLEGAIVKIYNSGRVMFLQFSDSPETDAKVVIFPSDWGKWPQRPDLIYMGKTIRVTGKVVKYQGAPEIVINDPKVITIIGQ
jgi:phosphatidylserine/phosphatidylglycerophosphate/cardiolipin synthase-like enzyme